jgi:hypothetical protein
MARAEHGGLNETNGTLLKGEYLVSGKSFSGQEDFERFADSSTCKNKNY